MRCEKVPADAGRRLTSGQWKRKTEHCTVLRGEVVFSSQLRHERCHKLGSGPFGAVSYDTGAARVTALTNLRH
jgi:hypothetical protein